MRYVAMLLSVFMLAAAMAGEPPPAATSAQASSASSAKPAAATAQPAKAEELTAEEKDLVAQGYKMRMVDGERRFCRKQTILGSNLERNICTTARQVAEARRNGRDVVDQIQRNQANPNGH